VNACAKCGEVLNEGVYFCEKCGTPLHLSEVTPSRDDIERLLSEAHLLRSQEQQEDAIALCTRVLRLDPMNAAAPALLGDIYREQLNYQEALGWYKLAVQRNPDNLGDRRKLDEMIDRVFHGLRKEASPVATNIAAFALPASTVPANTQPPIPPMEGGNWFTRLQPTHVVIACSVFTMLVVAVLLWNSTFARHSEAGPSPKHYPLTATVPATTAPLTTDTAPGDVNNAGSAVVAPPVASSRVNPPPPDAVEGGEHIDGLPGLVVKHQDPTPKPSPTPAPTNGAFGEGTTNLPPYTPATVNPLTAEEVVKETQQLQAAMERMLKDKHMPFQLNEVVVDPRTGNVTVDYTIPRTAALVETRKALLYAGFHLVWTATAQKNSPRSYTLRGFAYGSVGNDPSLAMVADVTPQQADAARTAVDYRTVSGYLTDPWWRADLTAVPL